MLLPSIHCCPILLLIIGLVTEALIFGLSAFDPVDTGVDWSLVYPELAGGEARKKEARKEVAGEAEGRIVDFSFG